MDPVIDHNIALMAMTMVGKFLGPRPNIDIVREYARKKWALKGKVEITAITKGALSLTFSCEEDMTKILCSSPCVIRNITMALQKWSSLLDLNASFFSQAPMWVRLLGLPL